jgi:hypothetical protein
MPKKALKVSHQKKQAAATETHESIADQVSAFLAAGGEIQQIKSGISGQKNLSGPRHIVLGKKQG